MTITYHKAMEQGSDEWHAIRCGILTASEVKHILTPTLKIANNDKTRAHVYEIAAQRATGYTEPAYISDDMLRGMEDEIYAREVYERAYASVDDCGFVTNDDFGFTLGYSPDGLIGMNGLIEIKSRRQKFQMETIASDAVPEEYMLQLQTGLLATGRKWIDFISYCAGMPMFVKRVEPIEEYQVAIREAAAHFEGQVQAVLAAYNNNAANFQPTTRRDTDFEII